MIADRPADETPAPQQHPNGATAPARGTVRWTASVRQQYGCLVVEQRWPAVWDGEAWVPVLDLLDQRDRVRRLVDIALRGSL